jgi:hypothetical protein
MVSLGVELEGGRKNRSWAFCLLESLGCNWKTGSWQQLGCCRKCVRTCWTCELLNHVFGVDARLLVIDLSLTPRLI